MPLDPGARLGPYEIVSLIARGGMGEVYRAHDPRLDRPVALKVLPAGSSGDRERLARFETEARAASALSHPNIITVYDVGASEGLAYLAMELVEGDSLRVQLDRGPLPVTRALSYARQVADALAFAHARGVVHRDLKPENVLVGPDGRLRVADFGLAKRLPPDLSAAEAQTVMAQTREGQILGTCEYMAPEQAAGRATDARADQFAFGVLVHEMLTGVRVFARATPVQTLAAVIEAPAPPPGDTNREVPPPLDWLVQRCLAKEASARYPSMREVVEELGLIDSGVTGVAVRVRRQKGVPLPAVRTACLGREEEVATIAAWIAEEGCRLVTLTGPGGIGKTRLAVEAGRRLSDHFGGSVAYASLAATTDSARVTPVVAEALGVETGHAGPLAALQAAFGHGAAPALLVVDNFEQVVEAADALAGIVDTCPAICCLVTSRAVLRVAEERELRVGPLRLPEADTVLRPDDVKALPSVALFVERARAAAPSFALTPDNAAVVADICRRLDGLPLAIELAAARMRLFSPATLQSRLTSRLAVLTGGTQERPRRHQTLRATIESSHDLLDAAEQRLFRRLAVFVGGFTLDAAEAVCDAREDLGVHALDGVTSLYDKSLVQRVSDDGDESRFAMLETIREFAMERLAETGDEAVTRRAHAAYCVVLAEEADADADVGRFAAWMARLGREVDNIRAALAWLIAAGEADWALRLVAALVRFWEVREWMGEGRAWIERALAVPGADVPGQARARALLALEILVASQGSDISLVEQCANDAGAAARAIGNERLGLMAQNAFGVTLQRFGDYARGASLLAETLEGWRRLGETRIVAQTTSNLAILSRLRGDYAGAMALFQECLSLFSEVGDRAGVGWCLSNIGDVERDQGRFADARRHYEESLAAFHAAGDEVGQAATLLDLGEVHFALGDRQAARETEARAFDLVRRRGLREARTAVRVLEASVLRAWDDGRPRDALVFAGAAAVTRRGASTRFDERYAGRLDDVVAAARSRLGEPAGAAWMEGWALSIDEALARAFAAK